MRRCRKMNGAPEVTKTATAMITSIGKSIGEQTSTAAISKTLLARDCDQRLSSKFRISPFFNSEFRSHFAAALSPTAPLRPSIESICRCFSICAPTFLGRSFGMCQFVLVARRLSRSPQFCIPASISDHWVSLIRPGRSHTLIRTVPPFSGPSASAPAGTTDSGIAAKPAHRPRSAKHGRAYAAKR